MTCEVCRFFDVGHCRRWPPETVLCPSDNQHPIMYVPSTAWPLVSHDDWCGEFKPAINGQRGEI